MFCKRYFISAAPGNFIVEFDSALSRFELGWFNLDMMSSKTKLHLLAARKSMIVSNFLFT